MAKEKDFFPIGEVFDMMGHRMVVHSKKDGFWLCIALEAQNIGWRAKEKDLKKYLEKSQYEAQKDVDFLLDMLIIAKSLNDKKMIRETEKELKKLVTT